MSEHLLRIIPTTPDWLPDEASAAAAQDAFVSVCPGAEKITIEVTDAIEFVDPGENFLAVRCPSCRVELDPEWWPERMGEAYERGFEDLGITTPCCGIDTTLNDLDYDWPAGFSRFVLTASSPGRDWLTAEELETVSSALSHPVRQILVMY